MLFIITFVDGYMVRKNRTRLIPGFSSDIPFIVMVSISSVILWVYPSDSFGIYVLSDWICAVHMPDIFGASLTDCVSALLLMRSDNAFNVVLIFTRSGAKRPYRYSRNADE